MNRRFAASKLGFSAPKSDFFPPKACFIAPKFGTYNSLSPKRLSEKTESPIKILIAKFVPIKKTIISQSVFFGFRNCKIGFRIRFCQIAKADFGMKNGKTKRKRLSDQSGISLYAYQRLVNFFHRPSRQSVRSAVPKTAIYCSCLVKQ